MLLSDIAAALGSARIIGDASTEVADVVHVASEARPGCLFVCVVGRTVDGHALAPEAVARGAVALVVERELALPVAQIVVPAARAAMAPVARALFADPSQALRVLGVTGTNGKTTTSFIVRGILEAAGLPCGVLGTVELRIGGVAEPVARTTPEAIELQRALRRMLDAGDRACAMEVSSHALAIGRVDGVRFAAAAFTNLSQDHLDFHGSLDEYFAAKALLFDGRCPRATNADDDWGRTLPAELRYAIDAEADVRALDVDLRPTGTRFTLRAPDGARVVATPLVGRFNVENALAAASLALLVGVDLDAIATGLAAPPPVPGRMERVDAGQPFAVIVDYAHTPDALETVLRTARGFTAGRVHVVFGCGGDRDPGKRPLMGAAAAALADRVVVTSDNPRSEEPEAIAAEIVAGMPVGSYLLELDRRAAIALALADAAAGDVVVIAGKGHEQGQEAGGVVAPFDDRVVAREVLAA